MRRQLHPLSVILFSLFVSAVSLSAQSGVDIHTSLDSARTFYTASSWAHGYIHGYEQGFHLGDVDIQLAKAARDPRKVDCDDFKIRAEYGDRGNFKKGFRQGLQVGYADAYKGREFRAVRELRRIAQGFESPKIDKNLDNALADGYKAGLTTGLSDARNGRQFSKPSETSCDNKAPGFCSIYERGVELGYSDGFSNQRNTPEMRTARK